MNGVTPQISLAPMEGVIDHIMRRLLTQVGGLDRTTTEFVRITNQLLPEHVFLKFAPELRTGGVTESGVPVFVQLLGGEPQPMAENAALAASLGAPGIDLNFGCPAKTVNRHDGGATLLKNPERLFHVTSAVRKAVPANIPVTAKVRLGFEHKNFVVDLAQAVENAGASALTVHARTKMEMYQPPAHWEYIALMREAIQIPVYANGEIWSVEDYWRCREISGCTHVALGRGLVARPDLARQIKASLQAQNNLSLPWQDTKELLLALVQESSTISPRLGLGRGKQWLKNLGRTYPEAQELFSASRTYNEIDLFKEALLWPKSPCTPGPYAPTA